MPYVAKLITHIASQTSWYTYSGTRGFITPHIRRVSDPHVPDAIIDGGIFDSMSVFEKTLYTNMIPKDEISSSDSPKLSRRPNSSAVFVEQQQALVL